MAVRGLILVAILVGLVAICYGQAPKIKIPETLTITTIPSGAVNLKAGEGKLTVSWELNKNVTDTSSYKSVKVRLCYLPESQKDRPWRKTNVILKKDKSCQHAVAAKPTFTPTNNTVVYTVAKNVPSAFYFVRAYVYNASDKAVAYGQTADDRISITAITGRHVSIDISAAVFSAFSIVSLAGFFYLEKKKGRAASAT